MCCSHRRTISSTVILPARIKKTSEQTYGVFLFASEHFPHQNFPTVCQKHTKLTEDASNSEQMMGGKSSPQQGSDRKRRVFHLKTLSDLTHNPSCKPREQHPIPTENIPNKQPPHVSLSFQSLPPGGFFDFPCISFIKSNKKAPKIR